MSETFTMRIPAGENQVFAPGALDRQIGQSIPVWHRDGRIDGLVLAAEVTEDGAAMLITVQVSDGSPRVDYSPGIQPSRGPV